MKLPSSVTQRKVAGWRMFSAWVCFVAWLFATPAVVPVVVGFLGNLDGRHVVSIAEGRESTVVVLHHQGGMPSVEHRHTLLSGMLVAFSQSDRETRDHLLVFPRTDAAVSEDPLTFGDIAGDAVPDPVEWCLCDGSTGCRTVDNFGAKQPPYFLSRVAYSPTILVLRI